MVSATSVFSTSLFDVCVVRDKEEFSSSRIPLTNDTIVPLVFTNSRKRAEKIRCVAERLDQLFPKELLSSINEYIADELNLDDLPYIKPLLHKHIEKINAKGEVPISEIRCHYASLTGFHGQKLRWSVHLKKDLKVVISIREAESRQRDSCDDGQSTDTIDHQLRQIPMYCEKPQCDILITPYKNNAIDFQNAALFQFSIQWTRKRPLVV